MIFSEFQIILEVQEEDIILHTVKTLKQINGMILMIALSNKFLLILLFPKERTFYSIGEGDNDSIPFKIQSMQNQIFFFPNFFITELSVPTGDDISLLLNIFDDDFP